MLRYSQKGYRMRVRCVVGVFILLITVGGAALSQDDAGKLVLLSANRWTIGTVSERQRGRWKKVEERLNGGSSISIMSAR